MRTDYYTVNGTLDVHPRSGQGQRERNVGELGERVYGYLYRENMRHRTFTLPELWTFKAAAIWFNH